MGKYTDIVVGLLLIVIAIALLALWPNVFFWPMVTLIEGAIAPAVAFIGIIFLMIGISESEEVAPIVEEKKKKKK